MDELEHSAVLAFTDEEGATELTGPLAVVDPVMCATEDHQLEETDHIPDISL
jgi:hydroxymethylpyrimidine/phosphomethylpyrimidine kinase